MTRWGTWFGGRSVLVIGGLGFIGVNLTQALLATGARVTVLTPSRDRRRETAAFVEGRGAAVIEGDIRDGAAIAAAVTGQDVVYALAGQSGAARSMEDPFTDLDVNLRGNLTVLEALRTRNPEAKLVFPGSRLQYGRAGSAPVVETDAMQPVSIHGAHKAAVELYLAVYRDAYGIRSTCVRITNPYGPGQRLDQRPYGIVNRMVQLALADLPIPVFGDGAQLRDYVFIDDVVQALLAVGQPGATDGHAYNLGSGTGTRLVDMARMIQRAVGAGTVTFAPWPPLERRVETGDFIADVSRLTASTGWRPRVAIEDGLRLMLDTLRRA
jgi:UDP-glucose 4-epimerase